MRCGSILVRADEVLFAIANTGDTSEVFLRNGRSVIVKMCLAEFEVVWNNALNEIDPDSNKPLRNCDRFNTGNPMKDAEDAYGAWQRYCDDSTIPPSCKVESAFRQWLFATAKSETEGGNDE